MTPRDEGLEAPLACPACGEKPFVSPANADNSWAVECMDDACRMIGPTRYLRPEAIAAWNEVASLRKERDEARRIAMDNVTSGDAIMEARAEIEKATGIKAAFFDDVIMRLIAKAKQAESELADARLQLVALRASLESVWSAIGDALCSGGGIDKKYANAVANDIKIALRDTSSAAVETERRIERTILDKVLAVVKKRHDEANEAADELSDEGKKEGACLRWHEADVCDNVILDIVFAFPTHHDDAARARLSVAETEGK